LSPGDPQTIDIFGAATEKSKVFAEKTMDVAGKNVVCLSLSLSVLVVRVVPGITTICTTPSLATKVDGTVPWSLTKFRGQYHHQPLLLVPTIHSLSPLATHAMRSLFRLGLLLLSWLPRIHGGYLVLQGYELKEVSRDHHGPFPAEDGVQIHPGSHKHDPCTDYLLHGERFLLQGSERTDGKGFVAVNDCQVVECTKWTDPHADKFGGETVRYDLVKLAADHNPTTPQPQHHVTKTWKIVDDHERQCACQGEASPLPASCHAGKFVLVDVWNPGQCQTDFAVQTKSSISCTPGEAEIGDYVVEVFRGWEEELTDLEPPILFSVAGLLLVCCLCCCGGLGWYARRRTLRRKRAAAEDDKRSVTTNDEDDDDDDEDFCDEDNEAPGLSSFIHQDGIRKAMSDTGSVPRKGVLS
jgi:hypothetical protein